MVVDISLDEDSRPDPSAVGLRDRDSLRRVIHVLLVLYLAPVFVLVIVLSLVMIAVFGAGHAVAWVATFLTPRRRQRTTERTTRPAYPGFNLPLARVSAGGSRSTESTVVRSNFPSDKFPN